MSQPGIPSDLVRAALRLMMTRAVREEIVHLPTGDKADSQRFFVVPLHPSDEERLRHNLQRKTESGMLEEFRMYRHRQRIYQRCFIGPIGYWALLREEEV